MAGGPFAEHILCMTCAGDGVVTRAERAYEGVEDDHYICPKGHRFGIDWSRGAPESPQWPPEPDEVAAIEAMADATAERRFVAGVPTDASAALAAWLEARRLDGRRVRLPIVLVRGVVGFSLRDARIGGGPAPLTIVCDDSALGIGLADRARMGCGDAATCALWLEGHWRGGAERVFAVVKIGDVLPAEALAGAVAEVEAP